MLGVQEGGHRRARDGHDLDDMRGQEVESRVQGQEGCERNKERAGATEGSFARLRIGNVGRLSRRVTSGASGRRGGFG